jgi:hypothetical protein
MARLPSSSSLVWEMQLLYFLPPVLPCEFSFLHFFLFSSIQMKKKKNSFAFCFDFKFKQTMFIYLLFLAFTGRGPHLAWHFHTRVEVAGFARTGQSVVT